MRSSDIEYNEDGEMITTEKRFKMNKVCELNRI